MQITLTSKEFDEAVLLWLEDQGFSPDRFSISTRVIAGRSDGPLGTRIEVNLDPKEPAHVFKAMGISTLDPKDFTEYTRSVELTEEETKALEDSMLIPQRKFGQGHANE